MTLRTFPRFIVKRLKLNLTSHKPRPYRAPHTNDVRACMDNDGLFLVFSNPSAGREDEFNAWYEETHIPDVLKVPGVASAQRYAIADVPVDDVEGAPKPPPPEHRYLAVYRLDRDPAQVMKEMTTRTAAGVMVLNDAMDFSSVVMSMWQPMGEARTTNDQ